MAAADAFARSEWWERETLPFDDRVKVAVTQCLLRYRPRQLRAVVNKAVHDWLAPEDDAQAFRSAVVRGYLARIRAMEEA